MTGIRGKTFSWAKMLYFSPATAPRTTTSTAMAPTSLVVREADATLLAASRALLPVASPTAVPAAATSAVSSTAVPVAVSHPKNAAPIPNVVSVVADVSLLGLRALGHA
ncbi:hypothetical protein [Pengzhenrongella sp.]|uniref:hypothetical protein n=1 Tax=Pengzhenrongella sp. TaxID=2888820 RepID=UPI002F959908